MLHHIPRFLARELSQSEKTRVALLLVDGLALDQWVVMREVLGSQCPDLRFHDDGCFCLDTNNHLGISPVRIRWKGPSLFPFKHLCHQ